MTHYIVAWTGGYEAPDYQFRATRDEAFALAAEWLRDLDEGDSIDVLAVDTTAGTVTRIDSGTCTQCAQPLLRDPEGTLIDLFTGGDVCGALGGNEPHTTINTTRKDTPTEQEDQP